MTEYTPGPWSWTIHDHSMASLGVGDSPGIGDPLVLAIAPCDACASRANPKEWKWDRCHTPSEADAVLIAAAPTLLVALQDLIAAVEFEVNEKGGGGVILARLSDARAAVSCAFVSEKRGQDGH